MLKPRDFPDTSAHSERAIQVHGILVYYSCTTNLVYLSYLCTSRASLVLVHPSRAPLLSCTQLMHPSHAPPISCTQLMHHLCTHLVHLYSRAPISCTSTLVHPSRASPISCTTCAPLCILVHLSCTTQVLSCTTLVLHSRAPLTSFLNCRGTSCCLAV